MNALTKTLLHTLLERLEQPGRSRVVRLRLDEKEHAPYFDGREVQTRQEVNEELEVLETLGGVKLHWRKWEKGNWLEAVDVINAEPLYKFLRRSPRSDLARNLLELVDDYKSTFAWVNAWHDDIRSKIQAGKAVTPLRLDDYMWSRDLLALVKAVTELEESVLERTLSVKLFKDSKWLESFRSALLTVLRRHAPEVELFAGDDKALLESFNLFRVPEYVLVSGSLVINKTDVSQLTSVGLPATVLRSATLTSNAKRIVTVENQTSFESLAALKPADTLLVFSGGFASPTVIALLRKLQLPLYHWGDIDVGGLRILAHLRRELGDVKKLLMVKEVLEGQAFLQSLSEKEYTSLETLREEKLLEDCAELIDTVLLKGKLEQEALSANDVLGWLEKE